VANGIKSDPTPFNVPGCAPPTVYCSSKLTSGFTSPTIGYTGVASQSGPGFSVTLSQALPNKNGILFYGLTQNAAPFQGGIICTHTPVVRSPIVTTTPTSAASQAISIDASMVSVTRYYQWWFRDPMDTWGAGLSNALAVTFCD
jgi:hypothetical protein